MGRFLNADGLVTTGQGLLGNNMFAYCLNNPINYFDPTGTYAVEAVLCCVGLVVCCVLAAYFLSTAIVLTIELIVEEVNQTPRFSWDTAEDNISQSEEEVLEEAEAVDDYYDGWDDDDDDWDDDYYNDDNNFGGRKKIGKPKGNTPGSNQAQNRQYKNGKKNIPEKYWEQAHDLVTGQGFGYKEVIEHINMFVQNKIKPY